MNPKLLAACRILETPSRNLESLLVPLLSGGRGLETGLREAEIRLKLRIIDLRAALEQAEKTLQ
jgi:hypothetical protein